MSTTEAEYMAIAEAGKELAWLKNFLKELDRAQTECVQYRDNQSAIHLAKNPVFHGRTKHIKIRYHYIRELVSEGTLSLKKILGAKNPVDMLTKVIPCIESILALSLVSAACSVCSAVQKAEGPRLRAEGSDVDMMKHSGGRTLLTQKLLGILLLSREEED
ncbi:hypothetical protein Tco_1101827 [Tanacetum coccineum]